MAKLQINPEFEALCPPLSSEEFERLAANIIEDGRVLDDIVTWRDQIIDGHNRFKIATKHKLKYDTVCRTFADANEAKNWIINHQLGRRNLSPQAASYLRGKLYNGRKQHAAGRPKKLAQNEPISEGTTAQQVADATRVSPATVKRDGQYAESVDSLAKPIKDAIQSGDLKATKSEVQQLAEYDKKSQQQIVASVKSGEAASIKEAIGGPKPAKLSNGKTGKKGSSHDVVNCVRCGGAGVIEPDAKMPKSLASDEGFVNAWQDFVIFRSQSGKKLTTISISRLFTKMEKWGPAVAVEAIENSITNGWQGVFHPTDKTQPKRSMHLTDAEADI